MPINYQRAVLGLVAAASATVLAGCSGQTTTGQPSAAAPPRLAVTTSPDAAASAAVNVLRSFEVAKNCYDLAAGDPNTGRPAATPTDQWQLRIADARSVCAAYNKGSAITPEVLQHQTVTWDEPCLSQRGITLRSGRDPRHASADDLLPPGSAVRANEYIDTCMKVTTPDDLCRYMRQSYEVTDLNYSMVPLVDAAIMHRMGCYNTAPK